MAKKLFLFLALMSLLLSACGPGETTDEESLPRTITERPEATATVLKKTTVVATVPKNDSQASAGTSAPSQNSAQNQPGVLLSESRTDLEWVFILDAIDDGLVELMISGNGLDKINITVTPKVDFSFGIGFIPGLMFLTSSAGVQPMVLLEMREVILEPGISIDLELEVACADKDLEAPKAENTFTIAMPSNNELSRLAWVISESEESFRVKQFAVWMITNGSVRNIASSNTPGTGPSDDEWDRIHHLFELGEIPY